jgi:hypothetical protein
VGLVRRAAIRIFGSKQNDGFTDLLFNFSQAFDMVVHGLSLCKLRNTQNYSVGAAILVGSYLGDEYSL